MRIRSCRARDTPPVSWFSCAWRLRRRQARPRPRAHEFRPPAGPTAPRRRPSFFPCARALFRPACVRSINRSRSNSATELSTPIVYPDSCQRNSSDRRRPAPSNAPACRSPPGARPSRRRRSRFDRVRSSFVTTSTSSASSFSRRRVKPGRRFIATLPEIVSTTTWRCSIRNPAVSISSSWFSTVSSSLETLA